MDRNGSRRTLQVLSYVLLAAAVVLGAVTVLVDSPERDSSSWFLLASALAFAAMGLGFWRQRGARRDRS